VPVRGRVPAVLERAQRALAAAPAPAPERVGGWVESGVVRGRVE
jgi:hypothetical protein